LGAVVLAPAAEEDDGKAVFRKGPDDLVDQLDTPPLT
jgi:hypothetical protein